MEIGKLLCRNIKFLKISEEIDLSKQNLQECLKLLAADPVNLQIKIKIIQLCVADERLDICEQIVEELRHTHPNSYAVNYVLARWYVFIQNYSAARLSWNKVLEKRPELPDALVQLAYIDIAERKFDDALVYADKILAHTDPTARHKAHIIRVKAYAEIGNLASQADAWKDLLALQPDHLTGRLNYVQCMFRLERFEELLPVLDSSIKLYPQTNQFVFKKCDCFLRLGMHNQALELLRSVSEFNSGTVANAYLRANLLEKLGRAEEAEQACCDALTLQADHVPTLVLYARIAQGIAAAA